MSEVCFTHQNACYASLQVKAVGKDRLVLDLSCKKHNGAYHVATDRWQNISSLAVNEQSLGKLGKSCGEFLVHGVDVEGKQSGIDEELVKLLAEQSPVPVTYAGGVSSMVRSSSTKQRGKGTADNGLLSKPRRTYAVSVKNMPNIPSC